MEAFGLTLLAGILVVCIFGILYVGLGYPHPSLFLGPVLNYFSLDVSWAKTREEIVVEINHFELTWEMAEPFVAKSKRQRFIDWLQEPDPNLRPQFKCSARFNVWKNVNDPEGSAVIALKLPPQLMVEGGRLYVVGAPPAEKVLRTYKLVEDNTIRRIVKREHFPLKIQLNYER